MRTCWRLAAASGAPGAGRADASGAPGAAATGASEGSGGGGVGLRPGKLKLRRIVSAGAGAASTTMTTRSDSARPGLRAAGLARRGGGMLRAAATRTRPQGKLGEKKQFVCSCIGNTDMSCRVHLVFSFAAACRLAGEAVRHAVDSGRARVRETGSTRAWDTGARRAPPLAAERGPGQGRVCMPAPPARGAGTGTRRATAHARAPADGAEAAGSDCVWPQGINAMAGLLWTRARSSSGAGPPGPQPCGEDRRRHARTPYARRRWACVAALCCLACLPGLVATTANSTHHAGDHGIRRLLLESCVDASCQPCAQDAAGNCSTTCNMFSSCSGQGRCRALTGDCVCFAGWGGANCSRQDCGECDPCVQNAFGAGCAAQCDMFETCNGNGRCRGDTGACECYPGWTGPECDTPNECPDCSPCSQDRNSLDCVECNMFTTCNGHGRCRGGTGDCICYDGWGGPDCASEVSGPFSTTAAFSTTASYGQVSTTPEPTPPTDPISTSSVPSTPAPTSGVTTTPPPQECPSSCSPCAQDDFESECAAECDMFATCNGHGRCRGLTGDCVCYPGWAGSVCHIDLCTPCSPCPQNLLESDCTTECDMFSTCNGHGRCRGLTGDCECYPGWGGPGCQGEVCGDGMIIGNETCDDGNYWAYDGCRGCQVECGWDCSGGECAGICGDGMRKGAEECDDGNTESGDGCSRYCMVEAGFTCGGAWSYWECGGPGDTCVGGCGDGTRPAGSSKECDDGNLVGGDGCSASCQIECGWECAGGPWTVRTRARRCVETRRWEGRRSATTGIQRTETGAHHRA